LHVQVAGLKVIDGTEWTAHDDAFATFTVITNVPPNWVKTRWLAERLEIVVAWLSDQATVGATVAITTTAAAATAARLTSESTL
jgi:hypothetical protein